METLGYAGVAFLMFLENVFPPIPSELIMPLAGFSAARGEMTLWGVIVAGSVGSVLGQYPLYYLGRAVGPERLHRWADRHGKWLTVSGKDIEKAREWLNRRGPIAVLLCRLVPGVRSLISIPRGDEQDVAVGVHGVQHGGDPDVERAARVAGVAAWR
jgi:membrane protein DedA with SNARE-associated domain